MGVEPSSTPPCRACTTSYGASEAMVLGYDSDSGDKVPGQLELPFDSLFAVGENPALWTPRDIWVRLTQRLMTYFGEDRRIEYKRTLRVDFEDFATYLSAFSNTPDGGTIVFGATSHGIAEGCLSLKNSVLNSLETCKVKLCPQSQPEFKRIPVTVDGRTDFCTAVYIPYIGNLLKQIKQRHG